MIIQKFGGTSVGSAERMKHVAALICDEKQKIVVLSAMAGTTNSLVSIAEHLHEKKYDEAQTLIAALEEQYEREIEALFANKINQLHALEMIRSRFEYIRSFGLDMFTVHEEKAILAQGEFLSTELFQLYLSEQQKNSVLLDATKFMRLDLNGEPDTSFIQKHLREILKNHPNVTYFITQGFVCRNAFGEIDNLKRGGSDYSASLIGAAVQAHEIQIWTDIDGMHNNDPRIVAGTRPIARLTFDEAAELAYFGAKILHPSSVLPAQNANIPVRLKNTMDPKAEGTLISNEANERKAVVTAVAAKDQITAVKIKSGRMLMAYGFLRKIFEVFETYKTPIDMITTSEVAVSLTIDHEKHLYEIVQDLAHFGHVEVDQNLTIICVVGNFIAEEKGCARLIFDALADIPIRMISYGGSRHNVSILVNAAYKNAALQAIFNQLQNNDDDTTAYSRT